MLRKNIRLRREYLFHKEQDKDKQAKYDKKIQIKNAIMSILPSFAKKIIKIKTKRKYLQNYIKNKMD